MFVLHFWIGSYFLHFYDVIVCMFYNNRFFAVFLYRLNYENFILLSIPTLFVVCITMKLISCCPLVLLHVQHVACFNSMPAFVI